MKNAVIYARYSSDKQRDESITGQLRECRAFAEKEGLAIVHEYIDRAMSARTDKRPDFLRMIADSGRHRFEFVIVYQLDRFARNRYDSAIYKRKLKLNGVRVLSAKEHITSDPSGIIMESLLEGWAEYYSAELSQKVERGMTDNLLEKKWPGGTIPYGFMLDERHHLVQDPAASQAVHSIVDMYISGCTEPEVRQWLADHGYTYRSGRKFSRGFLLKFVKNRLLIGDFTWGGKTYPDFVEPYLSPADWERLQAAIRRRHAPGYKNHRRRRCANYALVGKLFCGVCGRPMTGTCGTSRNGSRHYYYTCSSHNNQKGSGNVACACRNVQKERLENAVLVATVNMLSNPEMIHTIAAAAAAAQKKYGSARQKISDLKNQLRDVQKKLQNSVKAVEAGVVSETLAANIPRYEQKAKELQLELERTKFDVPEKIDPDFIEFYLTQILKKAESEKRRWNVFSTFISRILLCTDHVEIDYTYGKPSSAILPIPGGSDDALVVNQLCDISNRNCMLFYTDYFALSIPRENII